VGPGPNYNWERKNTNKPSRKEGGFKGLDISPDEVSPVIPFSEFWEVTRRLLSCVEYVFFYV
jgi:hypothetical protein